MGKLFGLAAAATLCLVLSSAGLTVAEEEHPEFVIVERTATTGPEADMTFCGSRLSRGKADMPWCAAHVHL